MMSGRMLIMMWRLTICGLLIAAGSGSAHAQTQAVGDDEGAVVRDRDDLLPRCRAGPAEIRRPLHLG